MAFGSDNEQSSVCNPQTIKRTIPNIVIPLMIIVTVSILALLIAVIALTIYDNPLPQKPRMITIMNATGVYVQFDKCNGSILNCSSSEYIIIDNPDGYNQFNMYCSSLMPRPIDYNIKDIIEVAYDKKIEAARCVLYGCTTSFYSFNRYLMMWMMWISLIFTIVSSSLLVCLLRIAVEIDSSDQ